MEKDHVLHAISNIPPNLLLCTSAPLHLSSSITAPMHLCTSAFQHICNSAPALHHPPLHHLCTSLSEHLHTCKTCTSACLNTCTSAPPLHFSTSISAPLHLYHSTSAPPLHLHLFCTTSAPAQSLQHLLSTAAPLHLHNHLKPPVLLFLLPFLLIIIICTLAPPSFISARGLHICTSDIGQRFTPGSRCNFGSRWNLAHIQVVSNLGTKGSTDQMPVDSPSSPNQGLTVIKGNQRHNSKVIKTFTFEVIDHSFSGSSRPNQPQSQMGLVAPTLLRKA